LDMFKRAPVVLLALPFGYRYEINVGGEAVLGRSQNTLQVYSSM
jgi:hypothetical protein